MLAAGVIIAGLIAATIGKLILRRLARFSVVLVATLERTSATARLVVPLTALPSVLGTARGDLRALHGSRASPRSP
jgi:hypothetical protein